MRVLPGWLALSAALLFSSSCSHSAGDQFRRIAILPPEVLIDDASAQWMATALPVVWEEDLGTAPRLLVNVVRSASAAYEFGATEVLRTTVESRGGRLRLQGTLTEAATQRNRSVFEVEGNASAGLLPVANSFAKAIDSSAAGFSTKNERAFETFVRGLATSSLPARVQSFNDAIGIDPGFGLAYLVLTQAAAQSSPQSLPDLLAKAEAHTRSFTALDQAKFNALATQITRAPPGKQEAALTALLQRAPNNLDALAGLGSLRFLQGDAANGERLLARALEVSPGNPNVRQQLGRGLLETRRFSEAEKVFTGTGQSATILSSLAVCVLLEGDQRRANAINAHFSQSLPPNVKVIYGPMWLALSGNTAGAIAALEGRSSDEPNLHSAVSAELVIWQLMKGDFAGAKQTAAGSGPGAYTTLSLLLSRADEPLEEWQQLVESSELSADQKQSVLANGLFLGHRYQQAAQAWRQILERSGGTDLRARAMLAGSLDRAGNTQAARQVLVQPFVPEFGDLYAAVSFGEMRRLLNLEGK